MKKTNKLIQWMLYASIIIVPYMFILGMGLLNRANIISSAYSMYIVIASLLLAAAMAYISLRYHKKTKAVKEEKRNR